MSLSDKYSDQPPGGQEGKVKVIHSITERCIYGSVIRSCREQVRVDERRRDLHPASHAEYLTQDLGTNLEILVVFGV